MLLVDCGWELDATEVLADRDSTTTGRDLARLKRSMIGSRKRMHVVPELFLLVDAIECPDHPCGGIPTHLIEAVLVQEHSWRRRRRRHLAFGVI